MFGCKYLSAYFIVSNDISISQYTLASFFVPENNVLVVLKLVKLLPYARIQKSAETLISVFCEDNFFLFVVAILV